MKTLRTCKNGHQYYKSSDFPVCPICENENKSKNGLFHMLSAPAKRALENKGIRNLQELSRYTENDILQWHGIGKTTIPKLKALLETVGLKFNAEGK
ncbi:DNA-directed RNA polymerase subunit alpha C-terminal domain-containing protein [Confluentibacter citreus]|uniref:DNA-directed RNA polymerase subunit alpha C-terminal domain-containing protein n=1 Tax=Confluentibacter citreus TaxID=2007307 RepID=UPI000C28D443|nr:hypothetical protein [Confluentibacter citreus]